MVCKGETKGEISKITKIYGFEGLKRVEQTKQFVAILSQLQVLTKILQLEVPFVM